ncbi:IS66 family insertion sequence element accessory protein TnpA, partial [Zhongshania aliphaticivorans]
MSTINKSQFWQDHITAWQGSGLSQAAYCKQHEIKFHNFAYWRNRLSPAKEPSAKL